MGSLELVLRDKLIIKKRSSMITNISFQLVKSKLFSAAVLWREKQLFNIGHILHLVTKKSHLAEKKIVSHVTSLGKASDMWLSS